MSERSTRATVTFRKPFSLTGVDELLDAGQYDVDTLEEAIEGASFVGYRRLSTTLTINSKTYGAAARQVIEIDPLDLANALASDQKQAGKPPD